MRAMVIKAFGGTEVFEQREVPKPVPEPKQVLVRVFATSVNPLDYQTRRGDYATSVRLPTIIGSDVSGVVDDVGGAVTDFKVGDEVYYTPQIFGGDGSYAEYHVADESIIAHKPRNVSHFEAASLSLTGGTAWETLVTRGGLQVGESILIHAGAGGVFGKIISQLVAINRFTSLQSIHAFNHQRLKVWIVHKCRIELIAHVSESPVQPRSFRDASSSWIQSAYRFLFFY